MVLILHHKFHHSDDREVSFYGSSSLDISSFSTNLDRKNVRHRVDSSWIFQKHWDVTSDVLADKLSVAHSPTGLSENMVPKNLHPQKNDGFKPHFPQCFIAIKSVAVPLFRYQTQIRC